MHLWESRRRALHDLRQVQAPDPDNRAETAVAELQASVHHLRVLLAHPDRPDGLSDYPDYMTALFHAIADVQVLVDMVMMDHVPVRYWPGEVAAQYLHYLPVELADRTVEIRRDGHGHNPRPNSPPPAGERPTEVIVRERPGPARPTDVTPVYSSVEAALPGSDDPSVGPGEFLEPVSRVDATSDFQR